MVHRSSSVAAKLWEAKDGGVDGNIMRISLYRPDDEKFLSYAENFMKVRDLAAS